jgi:hypothetical protein
MYMFGSLFLRLVFISVSDLFNLFSLYATVAGPPE